MVHRPSDTHAFFGHHSKTLNATSVRLMSNPKEKMLRREKWRMVPNVPVTSFSLWKKREKKNYNKTSNESFKNNFINC